eukprot:gene5957-8210_t
MDLQLDVICIKSTILCTSFYTLQCFTQRVLGKLHLTSMRHPFPFLLTIGVTTTAINLGLSQYILDHPVRNIAQTLTSSSFINSNNMFYPILNKLQQVDGWNNHNQYESIVGSTLLGLSIYGILERKGFQTAFPMNILKKGVYGRSIPTQNIVATLNERMKIQELGKKFGCHQCGSKQRISAQKFIADHMPPTKIVKEMNSKWWRKILNIKIKQSLWPQCRKCFSIQGYAVRNNRHVPVYHQVIQLRHASPAIAYYLSQLSFIQNHLNDIITPIKIIIKDIID